MVATGSGKKGDFSLPPKSNHLFKRLMIQNMKTPDQLAIIALCLIFVSRSLSVIQGLAVLSLLKKPFVYVEHFLHSCCSCSRNKECNMEGICETIL